MGQCMALVAGQAGLCMVRCMAWCMGWVLMLDDVVWGWNNCMCILCSLAKAQSFRLCENMVQLLRHVVYFTMGCTVGARIPNIQIPNPFEN